MTELSPLFAIEAEKLLEQGRVPEAIDLCRQGIEEYPDYASAFGTLAKAYKLIGEQDQLDSTIRGAMERFPLIRTIKNIKVNVEAFDSLPENEVVATAGIPEEIAETELVETEIVAIEETEEPEADHAITDEEPETVATEEVIENEIETADTEEEIITSEEKVTEVSVESTISDFISQSEQGKSAKLKATDLGLIPGLDFANDEPSLKPVFELSDEPIIIEEANEETDSSEISIDSPTKITSETDSSDTDSSGSDPAPEITAEKLEKELLAAMKKESELSEMAEQINELAGIAAKEEKEDVNGKTQEHDLTSETLAGILEDQGAYKEALEAYEVLIETKPENSEFYSQKIIELKSRTGMK